MSSKRILVSEVAWPSPRRGSLLTMIDQFADGMRAVADDQRRVAAGGGDQLVADDQQAVVVAGQVISRP